MKLDILLSQSITLFEGIKVGQNALNRALKRADDTFQMGFEAEMVPSGSGAASIDVTDISFHDLGDYFDNSFNHEALWDYLSDNEENWIDRDELIGEWWDNFTSSNSDWYKDWIDENGYDDEPEDEWPDEDEAEQEIKDEHENEIDEWINEHRDAIDMDEVAEHWFDEDPRGYIDAMGMELNYDEYQYDEYGDIRPYGGDTHSLVSELEYLFDDPVEAFDEYHGGDKDTDTWYIEPDSSVTNGLEIVSPVKSVSESLSDMEKLFGWMESEGHETTDETGLHVSLSFTEYDEDHTEPDWVKLAVMMGETHVLEEFSRLGNTYTESQLEKLRKKIDAGDVESFNTWDGYQQLKKSLGNVFSSREASFNISSYEDQDGRIEFRITGNTDYHEDFKKVRNAVGRYVMFLEIAHDPNLYKKQYLTKLGKLLTGRKEDELKGSEEQLKQVKDSTVRKWLRAFTSAFGKLRPEITELIGTTLNAAQIRDQHQNDPQSQTSLDRAFFRLIQWLVPNSTPALNQELNMAMAESIGFIDYLIEKKKSSRLERMKLVARKFAKELNIDHEAFGRQYRHYPDDYVGKMRPEFNKIDDAAVIALLLYPDTEETYQEVIERGKKIKKLVDKIKGKTLRDLFIEMMTKLDAMGYVSEYELAGGIRNIVYMMQDEAAKNDPDIKKAIATMIQQAEARKVDVMKEILANTPGFGDAQEAIQYAHSIMHRHVPKEHRPKPEEVQRHDTRRREREEQQRVRSTQTARGREARRPSTHRDPVTFNRAAIRMQQQRQQQRNELMPQGPRNTGQNEERGRSPSR